MIAIKVRHSGNLGRFVYPDGYFDEYLLPAEVREYTPTSEREVKNSDGYDVVLNYVVTNNKKVTFFVEESMYQLIQLLPMYKYIQIFDLTNGVTYSNIYNVQLTEEESYNNGTVKSFSLTFAYETFITRNSA